MNRLTTSISVGLVLIGSAVSMRGCLSDLDDRDQSNEQYDRASGTTSQGGHYYGGHYGGYYGGFHGGSVGGDTHAGAGFHGRVGSSVRGGFGGSAHGGGS